MSGKVRSATEGSCRVSVLLSVCNGERYLAEALESLLAQTLKAFELIVVDDGSEDRTPEILHHFAARDDRLRILRLEERHRLPRALNRGLELCRAEWVARADADDVCLPERLARQMAYLRDHPEVGVLSCGFQRFTDEGEVLKTVLPLTGPARIRFQMLFMNCLLHPGVVFRRDLVRQVGGYDPVYWTAQDSDLWARLREHTAMDNLADPLVRYRVHPASTMKTRGGEGQRLSLSVPRRLLSAYLETPLPEAEAAAMVRLYQGFETLAEGELARALPGMHRVAALARRREPPEVRRLLQARLADSLEKQACRVAETRPREARRCRLEALRWQPATALRHLLRAGRARRRQPTGPKRELKTGFR